MEWNEEIKVNLISIDLCQIIMQYRLRWKKIFVEICVNFDVDPSVKFMFFGVESSGQKVVENRNSQVFLKKGFKGVFLSNSQSY